MHLLSMFTNKHQWAKRVSGRHRYRRTHRGIPAEFSSVFSRDDPRHDVSGFSADVYGFRSIPTKTPTRESDGEPRVSAMLCAAESTVYPGEISFARFSSRIISVRVPRVI